MGPPFNLLPVTLLDNTFAFFSIRFGLDPNGVRNVVGQVPVVGLGQQGDETTSGYGKYSKQDHGQAGNVFALESRATWLVRGIL